MSIFIVSEELSSMEIRSCNDDVRRSEAFQKNLVVWKSSDTPLRFRISCIVSEELSSMEMEKFREVLRQDPELVSEELSSMEIKS